MRSTGVETDKGFGSAPCPPSDRGGSRPPGPPPTSGRRETAGRQSALRGRRLPASHPFPCRRRCSGVEAQWFPHPFLTGSRVISAAGPTGNTPPPARREDARNRDDPRRAAPASRSRRFRGNVVREEWGSVFGRWTRNQPSSSAAYASPIPWYQQPSPLSGVRQPPAAAPAPDRRTVPATPSLPPARHRPRPTSRQIRPARVDTAAVFRLPGRSSPSFPPRGLAPQNKHGKGHTATGENIP